MSDDVVREREHKLWELTKNDSKPNWIFCNSFSLSPAHDARN